MPAISFQSVSKTYHGAHGEFQALNDVSLDVQEGEFFGLLGPNGAGKTTCFYMIVGLVKADSGSIELNSTNLTTLPIHARAQRGLGYLPQDSSIFRTLTVAENILAILESRKELTRPQQLQKLESLLDEFHIGHIRNNKGMSFGVSGMPLRLRALATLYGVAALLPDQALASA